MKKKILGGLAILAIAAVAVFNVNFNSKSSKLSDVSLANVEALADIESGGYYFCGVGNRSSDTTLADYSNYCGSCLMETFIRNGDGYCR